MTKEYVASSNISWIDYDSKKRELKVGFGDGTTEWAYQNVRPEAFEEFKRADSKGRYFAKYIKDVYEAQDVTKRLIFNKGGSMARGKVNKTNVPPIPQQKVNVQMDPIEKVAAVTPGNISEAEQVKQVMEKENVEVKAVTAQDVITKVDGRPSGSDGVEPHQVHLIQDKKTIEHFRHGNP